MEITVGLNEKTLASLDKLALAISSLSSAASLAQVSAVQITEAAGNNETETDEGPFYWADSKDGQFGKAKDKAGYDKLKKKSDTVYRIPESKYNELQEALRAKNEEKREENKAAKEAEKAAEKAAEKPKAETKKAPVSDAPSSDDLIKVVTGFLSKDLDADERKARAGFIKPMLTRFGVEKASLIPEEHRALAINLIERKLAGEDVDPETAELAEVGAAGTEADDDLV